MFELLGAVRPLALRANMESRKRVCVQHGHAVMRRLRCKVMQTSSSHTLPQRSDAWRSSASELNGSFPPPTPPPPGKKPALTGEGPLQSSQRPGEVVVAAAEAFPQGKATFLKERLHRTEIFMLTEAELLSARRLQQEIAGLQPSFGHAPCLRRPEAEKTLRLLSHMGGQRCWKPASRVYGGFRI